MSEEIKKILIIVVILGMVGITIFFEERNKKRFTPQKRDEIEETITRLKSDLEKDGFVKITFAERPKMPKTLGAIIILCFFAIFIGTVYFAVKDASPKVFPYFVAAAGIMAVCILSSLFLNSKVVDDISEITLTNDTLEINRYGNSAIEYDVKNIHTRYKISKPGQKRTKARVLHLYVKDSGKTGRYALDITRDTRTMWTSFILLLNSFSYDMQDTDFETLFKNSQK